MEINNSKEWRQAHNKRVRIIQTALAEGRDLTEDEARKIDYLADQLESYDKKKEVNQQYHQRM